MSLRGSQAPELGLASSLCSRRLLGAGGGHRTRSRSCWWFAHCSHAARSPRVSSVRCGVCVINCALLSCFLSTSNFQWILILWPLA